MNLTLFHISSYKMTESNTGGMEEAATRYMMDSLWNRDGAVFGSYMSLEQRLSNNQTLLPLICESWIFDHFIDTKFAANISASIFPQPSLYGGNGDLLFDMTLPPYCALEVLRYFCKKNLSVGKYPGFERSFGCLFSNVNMRIN